MTLSAIPRQQQHGPSLSNTIFSIIWSYELNRFYAHQKAALLAQTSVLQLVSATLYVHKHASINDACVCVACSSFWHVIIAAKENAAKSAHAFGAQLYDAAVHAASYDAM